MTEEFDSPWKDALTDFFSPCMELLFPEAFEMIQWEKPFRFLDQELSRILHDAPSGKQIVDKLIELYLRDGDKSYVLLHLEVQAQTESHFAQRMYMYNYRIYEKYKRRVASFAILADENSIWKPNSFEYNLLGCHIKMTYPIAKILDFRERWEELESSNNPFAIVVMAHLKSLETKYKYKTRFQWKSSLARNLYQKGYNRDTIVSLFRFIDGVMSLPKELENQFWIQVLKEEEVKQMPYVMSIERMAEEKGNLRGFEKGEQEGFQKGEQEGFQKGEQEGFQKGEQEGFRKGEEQGILRKSQENILDLLGHRFGSCPSTIENEIKKICNLGQLKELFRDAIDCKSLDEFQKNIEKIDTKFSQ